MKLVFFSFQCYLFVCEHTALSKRGRCSSTVESQAELWLFSVVMMNSRMLMKSNDNPERNGCCDRGKRLGSLVAVEQKRERE